MSNETSGESLGFRIGRCTVGTLTSPLYLPINIGVGVIDGLTQASNPVNAVLGMGTGFFVGAGLGMGQAGRRLVGVGTTEERQMNGPSVARTSMCWEPGVETFEKLAVSRRASQDAPHFGFIVPSVTH